MTTLLVVGEQVDCECRESGECSCEYNCECSCECENCDITMSACGGNGNCMCGGTE